MKRALTWVVTPLAFVGLLRSGAAAELESGAIAERVAPSVVRLSEVLGAGERGNGTGFVIGDGHLIVTNHPVVASIEGDLIAVFRDGNKARVLGLVADDWRL